MFWIVWHAQCSSGKAVQAEFVAIGFDVKAKTLQPGDVYIGYSKRCHPARWEPSEERLGRLDRSLERAGNAQVLSADLLHTLMSAHVCLGLLWRPELELM